MTKNLQVFTEQEVRQILHDGQGEMTQKQYAKDIGITAQYLNDVLRGRRSPGPAILDYLKLEKAYRPYWD